MLYTTLYMTTCQELEYKMYTLQILAAKNFVNIQAILFENFMRSQSATLNNMFVDIFLCKGVIFKEKQYDDFQ